MAGYKQYGGHNYQGNQSYNPDNYDEERDIENEIERKRERDEAELLNPELKRVREEEEEKEKEMVKLRREMREKEDKYKENKPINQIKKLIKNGHWDWPQYGYDDGTNVIVKEFEESFFYDYIRDKLLKEGELSNYKDEDISEALNYTKNFLQEVIKNYENYIFSDKYEKKFKTNFKANFKPDFKTKFIINFKKNKLNEEREKARDFLGRMDVLITEISARIEELRNKISNSGRETNVAESNVYADPPVKENVGLNEGVYIDLGQNDEDEESEDKNGGKRRTTKRKRSTRNRSTTKRKRSTTKRKRNTRKRSTRKRNNRKH